MTLTIILPASVEASLSKGAKREGVSLEDYVLRKLEGIPANETLHKEDAPADYLADIASKFKASMPEEEWNRLPADYAINFKEYLRASRQESAE